MTYGIVNADQIGTSVANTSLGAGNASIMKNRIINGAMVIDQRNAGASVTPTNNQFLVDRWIAFLTQASKYTVQQNAGSVTPPVGFSNYLGVTSSSAYSVVSSDYFALTQKIEGFNTYDLAWGTANAKTVTLSFWVYSSLTGTFGGSIINSAGNRAYPFTYTVSSANTWTQASVTIAGDTTGTWVGATNGIGLTVNFGLGVGSTYSASAGSWGSGSFIFSATGATSVVGTNGATFYITGVQLEVGSSATGFEYRQYGTELALCQRYYWKITSVDDGGSTRYVCWGSGSAYSSTQADICIPLKVDMRVAPTVSYGGNIYLQGSFGSTTVSSIGTNYGGRQLVFVRFNTSGMTAGQGLITFTGSAAGTDFLAGSAEL